MHASRYTTKFTRLAILPLAICLSLPFLTSSCSEEGLNEFVEAEMDPKSPIVIYTDTKIGTGDDAEDIEGPWFLAGFEITNKHPEYYLYLPSVQLDYSGFFNATEYEGETQLVADDICSDIDGASRSVYAIIAPNETFYGDVNCNAINEGKSTDRERVYFSGLPAPTDDDDRINSYRIKATFNGYYLNNDGDIVGNVELIRYYHTQ